ncbi:hypothetical protein TWF679_007113 [Orbilia oligospora]|uniref:Uncharacterized protein n=1 Tax=Orbilia oligospora TaxID=2813651 RepID=A0A8H8VL99_ORBOL|nr:hypothetical protein TWF679_007113 [Orbilia oligospora]
MGPQNHSWFYVGVHPNWDPNPLFFELKHLSSVKCNSRGENCVDFDSTTSGGFFVYTDDEIYNLEFASSVIELNFDRGDSGETGIHDDFGVDFTFTNNKAKASFYLKANRTEMTLIFTGNRNVSEITNELWNYPEIDLDTSDPETPEFKWRGGGAVAFGNDSPSRPQPTVVSLDSTSSTASPTSSPTSAMQSSTSSAIAEL